MASESLRVEIGSYQELKLAVILASDPTDFHRGTKGKKKKLDAAMKTSCEWLEKSLFTHTLCTAEYLQRGKSGD